MNTGIISRGQELNVPRRLATLKFVAGQLRRFGKWLIGGSVIAVVFLIWPVVGAELKYAIGQTSVGQGWVKLTNTRLELVNEQSPGETEIKVLPDWTVPDEEYSVYIPKILAKSKVIPNVDAGDKAEYSWALKLGIAEAAGMAHPGSPGTTYLFAHSVGTRVDYVRYNAVFYLLHKLEIGDKIEIVYKGELYKYQIDKKEVLAATDLQYFNEEVKEERLVLQTCYPPGTVWKRLIVVAKRSS